MPIAVACPDCGKQYKVPDQHAGKRFKCKACSSTVTVPAGEDEWDDDEDFLGGLDSAARSSKGMNALPPLPAAQTPTSTGRARGAKRRRPAKAANGGGGVLKTVLIIGGGLVGVVFLLGVVGAIANSAANTPVSEWATVRIGRSGATIKMPKPATTTTVQTPNGPQSMQTYERFGKVWLANDDRYGLAPGMAMDFDRDGAEEARKIVLAELERRAGVNGITFEGPLEQRDGYWSFRVKLETDIKGRTGYVNSLYVLGQTGIVNVQYCTVGRAGTETDAMKFFNTLVMPTIQELEELDNPAEAFELPSSEPLSGEPASDEPEPAFFGSS